MSSARPDVRVNSVNSGRPPVAYGRYEETITPKDATLAPEAASGHWDDQSMTRSKGACDENAGYRTVRGRMPGIPD